MSKHLDDDGDSLTVSKDDGSHVAIYIKQRDKRLSVVSLTYDQSVAVSNDIAEVAETIKPKPSKAERIREQCHRDVYSLGVRAHLQGILDILDEDGPL